MIDPEATLSVSHPGTIRERGKLSPSRDIYDDAQYVSGGRCSSVRCAHLTLGKRRQAEVGALGDVGAGLRTQLRAQSRIILIGGFVWRHVSSMPGLGLQEGVIAFDATLWPCPGASQRRDRLLGMSVMIFRLPGHPGPGVGLY